MAEDIKVTISADIAHMVEGLKQATSKLEDATKAMAGNLEKVASSSREAAKAHDGFLGTVSKSVKEYAAGAAAGFTVAAAIDKIVGVAKDYVSSIPEMIRSTGELADTFKGLRYETGASLDQLNTFHAALLLEGKSTEDLQTLFLGSQRGIKANADALVANGVAADKAALMAMPFEDYLRRVDELAQRFSSSTERAQFLMLALGKSGAAAGADLHELVERLDEARKLTENGGPISERSIQQMEEGKTALGRLNLEQEIYAANVSSHSASILTWWHNLRADMVEAGNEQLVVSRYLDAGLIQADRYALGVNRAFGPLLEQIKRLREEWERIDKASMDAGAHFRAVDKQTGHLAPDKPDKPRGGSPKISADNEVLSYNEVVEWSERYLQKRQETFDKDAKAAADYAAKLAREKAEYLNEESAKAVESQRKLAKDIQETWRKTTIKGGIFEYIQEAKKALTQWGTFAKQAVQGVESAFSSSLKGMLSGQMTLSQGLTNLWRGVRDAVIGMIAEMLAKWITSKLMEMILGKTAAVSQATAGAALYAINAMQSVAAIPFVGWAMAPGVGAAAYATGMSFAALASASGGWDRVPSDQLAMIHKNEMVLPAHLAEGARETFKRGGGGGGTTIINAVDARGVERVLRRNQGTLIRLGNEAARNNRRRA